MSLKKMLRHKRQFWQIKRLSARHGIADRAYDSNTLSRWLKSRGVKPVIPSHPCQKGLHPLYRRLYQRHLCVEHFFYLLKLSRRVSTRYEKRAKFFKGVLQAACMTILAV